MMMSSCERLGRDQGVRPAVDRVGLRTLRRHRTALTAVGEAFTAHRDEIVTAAPPAG